MSGLVRVLILLLGVFATSAILTVLLRQYALWASVLDQPTARSSHSAATPRGGGLAIVISFILALGVYSFSMHSIPQGWLIVFVGCGGLISAIGFVDDHRDVSAIVRFLVHVVAASVTVYLLFSPIQVQVLNLNFAPGIVGGAFAVLYIVWMTNLFNFMDGIDGIAGAQAIFVCMAASGICIFSPSSSSAAVGYLSAMLLALSFASLGFLIWNWPPARIFMGDVGSGYLGFAISAFAVITVYENALSVWTWLILPSTFFIDATVTLLRRMANGERWYEAHRSHAYQKFARKYGGHLNVTSWSILLNVIWILPIAWLSAEYPRHGMSLTVLAWLPLITICFWGGAGLRDDE